MFLYVFDTTLSFSVLPKCDVFINCFPILASTLKKWSLTENHEIYTLFFVRYSLIFCFTFFFYIVLKCLSVSRFVYLSLSYGQMSL